MTPEELASNRAWEKCMALQSAVFQSTPETLQENFRKLLEADPGDAVEWGVYCLFSRQETKQAKVTDIEAWQRDELLFQRAMINCIASHADKADPQTAAWALDTASFFADYLGLGLELTIVDQKREDQGFDPNSLSKEEQKIRERVLDTANMLMSVHNQFSCSEESSKTANSYDFIGETLLEVLEKADDKTAIKYLHVLMGFAHYHSRDSLEEKAELCLALLDPALSVAQEVLPDETKPVFEQGRQYLM